MSGPITTLDEALDKRLHEIEAAMDAIMLVQRNLLDTVQHDGASLDVILDSLEKLRARIELLEVTNGTIIALLRRH